MANDVKIVWFLSESPVAAAVRDSLPNIFSA